MNYKQDDQFPEVGYLRLAQIIGDRKLGIPAIIPICKSTWWQGVKSGRFPRPVKLSLRCTAWNVSDIRELLKSYGEEAK